MEQDPSPVTPFTRAGELGGLVQSDSTLTAASPFVEARARSTWFRVWNLSAPPNGAGRFGDAKDSADSRGVLLPGPYPKKGNGQQTPLLPDSMAHHPKMAGFCTFPYPLRSRQMLTQGPSQVASDGEPCMTRMRNTRAMSGTIPVALPIRDGVPGGVGGGCARTDDDDAVSQHQVAAATLATPGETQQRIFWHPTCTCEDGCPRGGMPLDIPLPTPPLGAEQNKTAAQYQQNTA